MGYGLRFHSISQSLGSSFSYFVQDEDMPNEDTERGYDVFEDIYETKFGNTFQYQHARKLGWTLNFQDVSRTCKDNVEHCCSGWIGSKQITVLAFGTSVIGTAESMGSMASAGQIIGTGYMRMTGKPRETGFDLWNFTIQWKQFGPDQVFN